MRYHEHMTVMINKISVCHREMILNFAISSYKIAINHMLTLFVIKSQYETYDAK